MSERRPRRQGATVARTAADARELGRTILDRVERAGAWAGPLVLHHERRLSDPRDRALLHAIVLGSLRWRRAIDHALAAISSRPLAEIDPPVLTVLRAAAFELCCLDRVPAFASVSSAVAAVRRRSGPAAAGFANAVLRKLAARGRAVLPPEPGEGDVAGLALWGSHPEWWVERHAARAGYRAARDVVEANNAPARSTLRVRRDAPGAVGELEAEGLVTEPGAYLPEARRLAAGSPATSAVLAVGRAWVQDEASQLVGSLLVGAGPRLADLCAAPGGKTLVLAEALPPGGLLLAADRNERRLAAAVARLRAAALDRGLVALVADLAAGPVLASGALFDGVLVDAPCSGTGTFGRRPELRWRLGPHDPARLALLQGRLLERAARLVRPGGRLVYSVCSLEPEEGPDVVESFLAVHGGFGRRDARELLPSRASGLVAADGSFRTSPALHGFDGFYAAVLERAPVRS